MSDRRYSTARWQKLRRAVLAHYGYVCQIEGPRCTGYATTVHHLIPSSQAPHLFLGTIESRRRLPALQLRRR
jgi:5-methylcytosine-specific restriction endonuclease McrA